MYLCSACVRWSSNAVNGVVDAIPVLCAQSSTSRSSPGPAALCPRAGDQAAAPWVGECGVPLVLLITPLRQLANSAGLSSSC